jgi:hypothetical protein
MLSRGSLDGRLKLGLGASSQRTTLSLVKKALKAGLSKVGASGPSGASVAFQAS